MNKIRIPLVVGIAIAVLLTGSIFFSFAEEKTLKLSGITGDDPHPNGCIDCHKQTGDGDQRLNVQLNATGHPDITAIVKTVPDNCAMCHKGDTLGKITHLGHFSKPHENQFISNYQGECLACHTLNLNTGKMSLKSGDKNW